MSSYRFVQVANRNNTDVSAWYFVAYDKKQLDEHWKKYAGSEIREGIRQLIGRLDDGSYRQCFTNNFAVKVYRLCKGTTDTYLKQALRQIIKKAHAL